MFFNVALFESTFFPAIKKKKKPHDELFMQLFIINVIITATLPQALSLTQPGNRNKLEHRKNKIFNQISLERVVLINDGLLFPTV